MSTTAWRFSKDRVSVQFRARDWWRIAALLAALGIAFVASFLIGNFSATPGEIWQLINGSSQDSELALILYEFRLPRLLSAIFAGALFAISGVWLQALVRNPLADPSLVGISQGAALAVVTLTIFFPDQVGQWRAPAAFVGSLAVATLVRSLSHKSGSLKFILMGIGLAAFLSALTSTMLTYGKINQAVAALSWLAGNVQNAVLFDSLLLGISLLIVGAIALALTRASKPMALGNETSIGLGVPMKRIANLQLVAAVFAAAIATAVVGPVGFLGLLAPHLARQIVSANSFAYWLIAMLIGALLLLVADTIGRTLFMPAQIAAGLLTSVIGAPVFVLLLLKKSQS